MSCNILKHVALGSAHAPTRKTRHTLGRVELGPPTSLRIGQYEGDPGYYLFYIDAVGTEITDTYHDSVEEAMAQAEWEFNVTPEEWHPWNS